MFDFVLIQYCCPKLFFLEGKSKDFFFYVKHLQPINIKNYNYQEHIYFTISYAGVKYIYIYIYIYTYVYIYIYIYTYIYIWYSKLKAFFIIDVSTYMKYAQTYTELEVKK